MPIGKCQLVPLGCFPGTETSQHCGALFGFGFALLFLNAEASTSRPKFPGVSYDPSVSGFGMVKSVLLIQHSINRLHTEYSSMMSHAQSVQDIDDDQAEASR